MEDETKFLMKRINKAIGHTVALVTIFFIADTLLSGVIDETPFIRPAVYALIAFIYFWIIPLNKKPR